MSCRCAVKRPRASLIVPSGDCSPEWLSRVMPQPLFGGEVALMWDPKRREARPVRFDWQGEPELGCN